MKMQRSTVPLVRSVSRWLVTLAFIALVGCSSGKSSTAKGITPTATSGQSSPTWSQMTTDQSVVLAQRMVASMTQDQKIEQLLMLQFVTNGYEGDSVNMVQKYQPGAIILYKYEMTSATQVKDMTTRVQHDLHIPALIAADQEGGFIDQLTNIYPSRPTATQIGASNDPQMAYAQGQQNARDLLALGLNTDLAPDVDVQTVDGPDQRTRTFGTTPEQVTKMAGAFMHGLQDTGVVAAPKHFPGLGAANIDAHLGLPVIDRSLSDIQRIDLAPYQSLLTGNDPPGMIMTTDLLMPAIDPDYPAELSKKTIQGILRDQMHYDGVVVTDALYMDGIKDKWDQYQAGVLALAAGCDMLLGPADSESTAYMINSIKNAVKNGTLTQARIDESARRVLTLKLQRGLIPFTPDSPSGTQGVASVNILPVSRTEA